MKKLGEGAFGVVWLHKNPQGAPFSRQYPTVAIKKITNPRPDSHVEVEVLRKLEHEYIVKYFDSFDDINSGALCIVMEFCDYGSLTERVEDASNEEWNVWRFMSHMSDALEYLHAQHPPVIHRDLNPNNILGKRNDEGSIRWNIADFGVARVLGENAYGEYYARSEVGTPIYMAPEALANKPYSSPADMWSLGAIISFYCNREHLFRDTSSVLEWEGGMSESTLDRDQYSAKLRGIVASLLLPIAKRRPTAAMVLEETKKGDRQRLE